MLVIMKRSHQPSSTSSTLGSAAAASSADRVKSRFTARIGCHHPLIQKGSEKSGNLRAFLAATRVKEPRNIPAPFTAIRKKALACENVLCHAGAFSWNHPKKPQLRSAITAVVPNTAAVANTVDQKSDLPRKLAIVTNSESFLQAAFE